MTISIKSTHLELTAAIKSYVEKKIGGLEKFLKHVDPSAVDCRVEVGKMTEHHRKGPYFRAEVNLRMPGRSFYAEAKDEDLYAAIDAVHDEVRRELVTFKEKAMAKNRRSRARSQPSP